MWLLSIGSMLVYAFISIRNSPVFEKCTEQKTLRGMSTTCLEQIENTLSENVLKDLCRARDLALNKTIKIDELRELITHRDHRLEEQMQKADSAQR